MFRNKLLYLMNQIRNKKSIEKSVCICIITLIMCNYLVYTQNKDNTYKKKSQIREGWDFVPVPKVAKKGMMVPVPEHDKRGMMVPVPERTKTHPKGGRNETSSNIRTIT